jgi:hypothetical protein
MNNAELKVPEQMKAAVIDRFGRPEEVMRVTTVPVATLHPAMLADQSFRGLLGRCSRTAAFRSESNFATCQGYRVRGGHSVPKAPGYKPRCQARHPPGHAERRLQSCGIFRGPSALAR